MCCYGVTRELCNGCRDLERLKAELATSHDSLTLVSPPRVVVRRGDPPGSAGYREATHRGQLVITRRSSPVGPLVVLVIGLAIVAFAAALVSPVPWNWEMCCAGLFPLGFALLGVVMSAFATGMLLNVDRVAIQGGELTSRRWPAGIDRVPLERVAQIVVEVVHDASLRHGDIACSSHASLRVLLTEGDPVDLLDGATEELRFIERELERHLGLKDDPSLNRVRIRPPRSGEKSV